MPVHHYLPVQKPSVATTVTGNPAQIGVSLRLLASLAQVLTTALYNTECYWAVGRERSLTTASVFTKELFPLLKKIPFLFELDN